ncbi:MAG TPA: molybdopterin-guanine dinucleotide biosynthesis protein B [Anaeromyxobacteraceae bacterium]|nr:molybdopterin-guanine dinucleotide biosynthesis protein B [Anaeromyxobacteraceae bacterium]
MAARRLTRAGARRAPPVVAFSGPSGAGKTTLLLALVRELRRRGLAVAAVKHSGHPHGFDVPGKDSDRLLRAGAVGVAVQGASQMALFRPPLPGGPRALAAWLPPADVVLVEGWKAARIPRVEVHRRAVSRDFACARGRGFVAVVTDEPPPRALPTFAPGQVRALADWLCERFGLRPRPRRAARRAST